MRFSVDDKGVIRQSPRNPAASLLKWALTLLAAAALPLALFLSLLLPTSGAAATLSHRRVSVHNLVQTAGMVRRERHLYGHDGHSARTAALIRKHKLAAIAQRSDAIAGSKGCEGEGLTPEAGNLEEVRAATLCLVNRQRLIHGELALALNSKLERSAQNHTISMVNEDYFSHYDPDGETPSERMKASGYIYSSQIGYEIGENIAWGTLSLSTPKAIVEAWMASPGHRENILDSSYRETAIGVLPEVPAAFSEGQQGAIYTQDFGVIITD